jgi:hypothetical protein
MAVTDKDRVRWDKKQRSGRWINRAKVEGRGPSAAFFVVLASMRSAEASRHNWGDDRRLVAVILTQG